MLRLALPALLLLLAAVAPPACAYSVHTSASHASIESFPEASPTRRLVANKKELLSILTPVYPDEHTLSLLRNQLRTFAAFADIDSFAAWVMVAPEEKLAALQMFLDFELPTLPVTLADKIMLVADEACAPELEPMNFALIAFNEAVFVPGWFKQQLLKLACAHLLPTPFYLITDADTLYLNHFSAGDLFESVPCNRTTHAVCNSDATEAYRAKTEMQRYVKGQQYLWIRNSAETLHLPVPSGMELSSGVTPQIMSVPLVAAIAAHLKGMLAVEVWERVSWRKYLVTRLMEYYYFVHAHSWSKEKTQPWTEYNLYWVYAHHSGLWDLYHHHAQLQNWNANAWVSDHFDGWDPCANNVTDEWNPGYWATFQSAILIDGQKVPGDAIWAKLAPCVPGWGGAQTAGVGRSPAREQQQRRQ